MMVDIHILQTALLKAKRCGKVSGSFTHLRCCNIIAQRFCNDTVNNVAPLRYDNVVVTLLCYVIHNVVATFLGVYKFSLPQQFYNDIVTLSQRSHNLELLAGMSL